MHTKVHLNPSSGSGEEVENVNCLTDDGKMTDDGQLMITIGHWSIRKKNSLTIFLKRIVFLRTICKVCHLSR